jgi:STE24 endopeptidase
MQMTVLMAFALVLVLGESTHAPLGRAGGTWLALGVGAYWLISAALSALIAQAGLRRLHRQQGLTAVSRTYQRLHLLVQAWLIAGLAGLLLFGLLQQLALTWPLSHVWLVQRGDLRLLQELLVVAIFLVALLLHWLISYRFDRALRSQVEQELILAGRPVRPGWTRRQYIEFHLRHQFFFVAVPLVLIMLARDLVGLMHLSDGAQELLTAAMVAVIFVLSPALLVHVWRTRPLADGELRKRIERLCGQVNLRYRQLRIWDTAGVIANAGVMGLHPAVRYVLVTDALLENMDDAQILAVFGHEAGHVKHHHLGYFLVYTAGAMTLCLAAVGYVVSLFPPDTPVRELELMQMGLSLLSVALIWGVGFGWLSRRFERQADVYGAWCAGLEAAADGDGAKAATLAAGAPTFVMALENVGLLNGMSRSARNFRHGSIASRVSFLKAWTVAGYTRRAFDRYIGRIKAAIWVVFFAGAAVAALTYKLWTN